MSQQICNIRDSIGFHSHWLTAVVLAGSLICGPALVPAALAQDSYLPREEVQAYIEELVADHEFSGRP